MTGAIIASHRRVPNGLAQVQQSDAIMLGCTKIGAQPGRRTATPNLLAPSGTTPVSQERGEVHRWFFVRENHKDMSAAEIKRAASAQPHTPSDEPNGSEILVRCLQAENVKFLWGYPGGAVLYIYDALYKQNTIEHVLVRHEQAAVHAADGYARATGDVGVAHVT
jgi:hypothetical protein